MCIRVRELSMRNVPKKFLALFHSWFCRLFQRPTCLHAGGKLECFKLNLKLETAHFGLWLSASILPNSWIKIEVPILTKRVRSSSTLALQLLWGSEPEAAQPGRRRGRAHPSAVALRQLAEAGWLYLNYWLWKCYAQCNQTLSTFNRTLCMLDPDFPNICAKQFLSEQIKIKFLGNSGILEQTFDLVFSSQ